MYNVIAFSWVLLLVCLIGCKPTVEVSHTGVEYSIATEQLCICYTDSFIADGHSNTVECVGCISLQSDSLSVCSFELVGGRAISQKNKIQTRFNVDSCLSSNVAQRQMYHSYVDGVEESLSMTILNNLLLSALEDNNIPFPNGNIGAKPGQFPVTSLVDFYRENGKEGWEIIHAYHDEGDLNKILTSFYQDSTFLTTLEEGVISFKRVPITFYKRNQLNAFEENIYGVELIKDGNNH